MRPGVLFAGRYQIEREAGAGGMATVYRARDVETDEAVALKILHLSGEEERKRFLREAEILAGLRHPAVVTYRAHGITAEGRPYLVMEWLEGETLASRLTRGRLSVRESVALTRAVAAALAAVHAGGAVHRDIKPSNLFLCGEGDDPVKILDFGITRLRAARAVTHTGTAVGTPGYMAPEQASGAADVGAAADVFSLGCVLFECLTGRPAFEGEHVLSVLAKVLLQEPLTVHELRPEVPRPLSALVGRMISKAPEHRPADMAALLAELDALKAEVQEAGWSDITSLRAPPAAPALTEEEQLLVSVLVIGVGPSPLDDTAPVDAVSPRSRTATIAQEDRLVPLIAKHGARFAWLADGTLIATMSGASAATDQAAQAAVCALAVRETFTDRPIAIATGRGSFGRDRRSPVGEAIERAVAIFRQDERSRSAAAAEADPPAPAFIHIDELTARLLDARFDVQPHGAGHILRDARSDTDGARLLLGKETPCVGRERELRVLEDLFEEASSEPAARAALVTAPAGTGKSRLRYELIGRLGSRAKVWIARGDPMRAGAAFGLLGQILRRTMSLQEGDPPEAARRNVEARVARRVEPSKTRRVAEFLGEMIGAPFPAEASVHLRAARQDARLMGDQMQRAWVDFLEAECRARPIVIVLEDLQWGDQPSVDYIDTALRLLRDQPLMVLALARPEVHERFPALFRDRSLIDIRLDHLSRRACERLIRAVLGDGVPAETAARLWERSAGNAFFLEELLRAVVDGREGTAPETVMAMLQSRIERLPAEERRVLRAGSVLGRAFWSGAVASLLGGDAASASLMEHLASLERGEWLVRSATSAFQGEVEHVFRHGVVREAAYAMLTDEDLRLGHRLAGEWLSRSGCGDAALLAEHFARGGEPAQAMKWYARAAEEALEGNDLKTAIMRAERAVECGAERAELGELRLLQAIAHRWRGDQAGAERCALAAMERLPRGSSRWMEAACEAALSNAAQGGHDMLASIGTEFSDLLGEDDVTSSRAIAAARLSHRLVIGRRFDVADNLLARLEQSDPAARAWLLQARAMRAFYADEPWTYLALTRSSTEQFEAAGDERSHCQALGSTGYACMQLGLHEEAEDCLRRAIAMGERLGVSPRFPQHNLGLLLAFTERWEEALAVESAAVEGFAQGTDRRFEGIARCYLARILTSVGRLEEAEREARRAAGMMSEANELAYARSTLAFVMLRGGRVEEAGRAADEAAALVLAAAGTLGEGEAFTRLLHAETLAARGDMEASLAAARDARDRLLAQAAKIPDESCRRSFLLRIPEHARTLELAARWAEATRERPPEEAPRAEP